MIHKTAIIHRNAEVPDDCEIGPYCVVGEGVVFGAGCRLHSHVVIEGPTVIGRENEFFPFCSIGQKTQDLKYKGEPTHLEIGDCNVFRESVTVHRATGKRDKTVIGNHNTLLAYAHVAHDCVLGDHIVMSNSGTLAGHVIVEDRAVIGGLTAVHQFCRIGRMAITGGCSKVVQDVPPFMMADGNPAEVRTINKVGLERNGVPEETQKHLRAAFKLLYRESGLNIGDAVAKIRRDLPAVSELVHLCNFVEKSDRGISR
ncbi:MAG: acyl-ACP--UDP-N-acetylglucosamine O-acyltransferase [Verrucomicrobia bacterium]|nr:acyl-ACP--UDP-N-acetylglucosamine O-acyltransferase [Verrucomicrobiota bacterium]